MFLIPESKLMVLYNILVLPMERGTIIQAQPEFRIFVSAPSGKHDISDILLQADCNLLQTAQANSFICKFIPVFPWFSRLFSWLGVRPLHPLVPLLGSSWRWVANIDTRSTKREGRRTSFSWWKQRNYGLRGGVGPLITLMAIVAQLHPSPSQWRKTERQKWQWTCAS